MADTHKNFAKGTLTNSPGTAGTSFILGAGEGALFAANMPVTIVADQTQPDSSNAEIGYVTAVSVDTLTVTRAQQSTTAQNAVAGWLVLGTITAKALTDIETDVTTHTSATAVHGATGAVVGTTNTQTLTNKTLTAPKLGSAGFIADANGNEILKTVATVTGAINEITISNAAMTDGPTISATGDDTDIDIVLLPKGAGRVAIPSDHGLNITRSLTTIPTPGVGTGTIAMEGAGATTRPKFINSSGTLETLSTTSATETLTNKTISLGSNTVSGTTAQFNTANTDGDFATLAGVETLTNKTINGSQLVNASVAPSKLATGAAYATVATLQTTTSTAYTDLTTVGPAVTVTIGSNGLAFVSISSRLSNNTAGNYTAIAFAISGATTRTAAAPYEGYFQSPNANNEMRLNYGVLVTGLAAGSTTFTMKYRVIVGGTGSFDNREISVIPL